MLSLFVALSAFASPLPYVRLVRYAEVGAARERVLECVPTGCALEERRRGKVKHRVKVPLERARILADDFLKATESAGEPSNEKQGARLLWEVRDQKNRSNGAIPKNLDKAATPTQRTLSKAVLSLELALDRLLE